MFETIYADEHFVAGQISSKPGKLFIPNKLVETWAQVMRQGLQHEIIH
jgi:hypothetical protein